MPVYKLLDEMPYEEFQGWFKYFNRRPVGWREDHRTSLLLNAQGIKKKGSELFDSLRVMEASTPKAIDNSFLSLLKSSIGGDKWEPTIE